MIAIALLALSVSCEKEDGVLNREILLHTVWQKTGQAESGVFMADLYDFHEDGTLNTYDISGESVIFVSSHRYIYSIAEASLAIEGIGTMGVEEINTHTLKLISGTHETFEFRRYEGDIEIP